MNFLLDRTQTHPMEGSRRQQLNDNTLQHIRFTSDVKKYQWLDIYERLQIK